MGSPIQFLIRRRCLLPFVVLALEGHAGDAYGVLTGVRPGVRGLVVGAPVDDAEAQQPRSSVVLGTSLTC